MRIQISFDSADTAAVRKLAVALHHVGMTAQLKVGVNGPEAWSGETPHLRPNQFAQVAAELITLHGESVADILRAQMATDRGVDDGRFERHWVDTVQTAPDGMPRVLTFEEASNRGLL